ncbi:hypothetical protein Tco_1379520 [Tanacetum coccineum]
MQMSLRVTLMLPRFVLLCADGGSFDNVRVNLGIDISRKAGEVPVAALNIKSEVDGAESCDLKTSVEGICLTH